MGGQPLFILSEDSERTSGRDAQSANITAGKAVAESVRTTLGPRGMDKMLVSDSGDVVITNDGATILGEMDIEHPAAQMIVEVAEVQEEEVGDGTTTAAVLAGQLLAQAENLIDDDVHPTTIVEGYHEAARIAQEAIDDQVLDAELDDDLLRQVATSSMTGKGTGDVGAERLAESVVRAVRHVADGAEVDREDIQVYTRTGASSGATELVEGIVIEESLVYKDMPRHVEDATVSVLDVELGVRETSIDAEYSVDDINQLNAVIESEARELRQYAETLADAGIDVIFVTKDMDDRVGSLLAKEGIMAFDSLSDDDANSVARVTGAARLGAIKDIKNDDLGHADRIRVERYGDDDVTFVEGGEAAGAVTLFVRGGTDHVVDELERAVSDAVDVVITTIESGDVVPGGGVVEIAIAQRIRDAALSIGGRKQLAVEAFADAIEMIPRTLAENAGLDPIDTLIDLKSGYEDNSGYVDEKIHSLEAMQSSSFDDELVSDVIELARKAPENKQKLIYEILNEKYIKKEEYRTWDLLNIIDIISYGGFNDSVNTDILEQIIDQKFSDLELDPEITQLLTADLPEKLPITEVRDRFNERKSRLSGPNSGPQSEFLSQILYLYSVREKCIWENNEDYSKKPDTIIASSPMGLVHSGSSTLLDNPYKYGIVEPSVIKRELIKSATEAATMIVRIDDVISAE